MSCLFIKSTFNLEIIYSMITTYQISTNVNFALCEQRVFRFLMCCRQSLLTFRMLGNLNPRKEGRARSLQLTRMARISHDHKLDFVKLIF
jgi:hypothetical protein